MPGKDGEDEIVEWELTGPHLFSHEEIPQGAEAGYLGTAYGSNTDNRFHRITLGPKRNDVDLSTHDVGAAPANVMGFASSEGLNATVFFYFGRGETVSKVKASNATLIDPSTEIDFGSGNNVTSMLTATNAAGVTEIIVCLGDADDMQIITAVANAGVQDTIAGQSNNEQATIVGLAGGSASAPRLCFIEGAVISQIELDSTTKVSDAPSASFATRATIGPETVSPTGFAMDGSAWIPGFDEGPYYLDFDFQEFQALILESDKNSKNGKNMQTWYAVGIMIPMANGLRFLKNRKGRSIGIEVYVHNETPVRGGPTAITGSATWFYTVWRDPVADQAYLTAGRPALPGDPHPYDMSYFVIHKLGSGIECDFLKYTGTDGGRTSPTLWMGYDDDVSWFTIGDTQPNEIADTNYRFELSGTHFLTELYRWPRKNKRLVWVEVDTVDCNANNTVEIQVATDGNAAESIGTVDKNGVSRIMLGDNLISGRRIAPSLVLTSNSTSTSPKLNGTLRMGFRLESLQIDNEYSDGRIP